MTGSPSIRALLTCSMLVVSGCNCGAKVGASSGSAGSGTLGSSSSSTGGGTGAGSSGHASGTSGGHSGSASSGGSSSVSSTSASISGSTGSATAAAASSSSGSTGATGPWVNRTPVADAGEDYGAVAAIGTEIVSVGALDGTPVSDVWISATSGTTWTNDTPESPDGGFEPGVALGFGMVAADSTGTHLVAALRTGDLWTSTNSGATWVNQTFTADAGLSGLPWTSLASDSSGMNLLASDGDLNNSPVTGDLWTSANGGVTWTNRSPTPDGGLAWQAVASDSTGTKLLAAATTLTNTGLGGDLWTTTNSGETWTNRTAGTAAGSQAWEAVASDSSGTHLVGVTSYDIWTSSDSGATWVNRTSGTAASFFEYTSVASSADGTVVIAGGASGVATSHDSGATWVVESTLPNQTTWLSVATNATGTMLVAAGRTSAGQGDSEIWVR